jgi:phenylpropionate dioxygenase-like ring-hydroxylating dioxygenase large terminal subunit
MTGRRHAYLSDGWFAMLAVAADRAFAGCAQPVSLVERYAGAPAGAWPCDDRFPGFRIEFRDGGSSVRPGAFAGEAADVVIDLSWQNARRIVSLPSGAGLPELMAGLGESGDMVVAGDMSLLPFDLFAFHDAVVERTFLAADTPDGPQVAAVLAADGDDPPACLFTQSPWQGAAMTIAKARYFDPAFHAAEVEGVWKRCWQMACRAEEIPEAGDVLVYDVAGLSILVVRGDDGNVRAFHNSCLHRGTQLQPAGACTSVTKLRCPYHGWTYGLDGRLEDAPCRWDFPQLGTDAPGLAPVQVGLWGGFVFVNPDPDAGPLLDYLGVLPDHFRSWPLDRRRIGAHVAKVIACNWKVGLEAFLEGYHVADVHPQALAFTGDVNGQLDVWEPNISRMIATLATASPRLPGAPISDAEILDELRRFVPGELGDVPETGGPRAAMAAALKTMLTSATGVDHAAFSTSEIIDAVNYFVFPNFMPWAGYGTPIVYRLRPFGSDPDQSILDVYLLYFAADGDAAPCPETRWLKPGESWTAAAELGGLGAIFDQDEQNFLMIQNGLKAGGAPDLWPSRYQESRIRHFHATLDRHVAGGTPE